MGGSLFNATDVRVRVLTTDCIHVGFIVVVDVYERTEKKGKRKKNFAPGPLPLCCFDGSRKIVERLGAEEGDMD